MAKVKEKCIYRNTEKDAYYLVLSISDMIYGRTGNIKHPNFLDSYMNQETGLVFKIDDININMKYCRNYILDDIDLEKLEFIRELTDEEFYPIKFLIESRYDYPNMEIDVHKNMKNASEIVDKLKIKKEELENLEHEIHDLQIELYVAMKQ